MPSFASSTIASSAFIELSSISSIYDFASSSINTLLSIDSGIISTLSASQLQSPERSDSYTLFQSVSTSNDFLQTGSIIISDSPTVYVLPSSSLVSVESLISDQISQLSTLIPKTSMIEVSDSRSLTQTSFISSDDFTTLNSISAISSSPAIVSSIEQSIPVSSVLPTSPPATASGTTNNPTVTTTDPCQDQPCGPFAVCVKRDQALNNVPPYYCQCRISYYLLNPASLPIIGNNCLRKLFLLSSF